MDIFLFIAYILNNTTNLAGVKYQFSKYLLFELYKKIKWSGRILTPGPYLTLHQPCDVKFLQVRFCALNLTAWA